MCPGWAEHGEPLVSAGRRRGPGLCMAVQPSDGSLITQHRRGIEGLAARRQSLRRYHRNNPYPSQASKGFVRVPVCVFLYFFLPPPHPPPSPSPVVVLCACTRKSFFSFPGSAWHRGSDHVKSERGRDRQTEQRRTSTAVVVAWLSGASKRKKRRLGGGGGGGSCGANESKINIYMGRVLKPYFASL